MNALFKIVSPWLNEDDSDDLIALHTHLVWLQKELLSEYEPSQYESFDDKLAEWLSNLPEGEERRWLFRILAHFFFVGKRQFDALCRASFNDDIVRWLIDKSNIDIMAPTVAEQINDAINKTWFCPITDSMRINSFLKLNGLKGHDIRPDWYSLELVGDPARINQHINNIGVKHLVLLEDFVGSGNQMRSTVEWASLTVPNTNILVAPLICCPDGVTTGQKLASSLSNVDFAPTLSLKPDLFLSTFPAAEEPIVFTEVRNIILQIAHRLGGYQALPFGYEWTGALVAMYTNCPDNTLPIFHHRTSDWAPLFPRVQRS